MEVTVLFQASDLASVASTKPKVEFAPTIGGGFSPPSVTIANVTRQQVIGTIRLAVILAQFSDISPNRTLRQIQRDYFGADHSVAAYYHNMSYGKLTIVGNVFGWYKLPYPESKYGRDCAAVDDADCSGSDGSWQIAYDVVPLAQSDLDFNNYDYFVFVHSGNGEESSGVKDDVWSVAYLSGVWVPTKSKTLTKFDIVPETEAGGAVPLGVYTHEFGHLLGLPDMYDTSSGKPRMGAWELMDKGLWNGKPRGSAPSELSSWSRMRLGWLLVSNVITCSLNSADLKAIAPLENIPTNGTVTAVIIPIDDHAYYLFENRQPIGNDAALPDHGLVGYLINEDKSDFSTIQNPGTATAYHLGDSVSISQSQVRAKVVAAYQTGALLVGFGPASDTPTQQSSTLTIVVVPKLRVDIVVNNQTYTSDPSSGQVTVTMPFSNVTLQISIPAIVHIKRGVRALFQTWDDGNAGNTRTILAAANSTLTATYKRQYLISVSSLHTNPSGSGWYDENSQYTLSVTPSVHGSVGTKYVFKGWAGDLSSSTNPTSFRVTRPMNITATWITLEWMKLTFYDNNNMPVPPSKIDKLTLKAPNGTVLSLASLRSNTSFWFWKGKYQVLTATVLSIDSATGTTQFFTSPNGVARIPLELYSVKFQVNDYIFGSLLQEGTVTINLPNGSTESRAVQSGTVEFNQLPHGSYPFTVSRDWALQVRAEATLPSQRSILVGMVVGPSLGGIIGIPIAVIVALIFALRHFRRAYGRDSSVEKRGSNDDFLTRWYEKTKKK
jgi:M6 family metalloprotease-like protein